MAEIPVPPLVWKQASRVAPKSYKCGHCGQVVGPNQGFRAMQGGNFSDAYVYVCSFCTEPTYLFGDKQTPGARYGNEVASLPADIEALYDEARDAMSVAAHTAAVLTCRKILMNIAVAQKAPAGKPFIEYVKYLADNGYVPPHGKGWVDHIRKKGNEANHEIALMSRADAEELLAFTEMLLKFVFEFPARVPPTT